MRVLVLGGTVFLGRAVARSARERGHDVTCLARGTSGEPVDGVRFVTGDRGRDDAFGALDGETFDALVDVARRPSHVRRAVAAFAGRVGHATFISSGSVYSDAVTPGQRVDTSPVLDAAPSDVDDPAGEHYGPCKVTCEGIFVDGFGADRTFVNRAGLIVGPEDPTGRFTYWVRRLARGGEVLAPGQPDDPVQLVDVRDLAGWIVTAAETGLAGTYDGIGAPMSRGAFLAEVAHGVGGSPTLTWIPQDFLVRHDVRPWDGPRSLPLWLPLPEYAGFLTRDARPSLAAGLVTRPLAETASDTAAWARHSEVDEKLTAAEESAVLRSWHEES